MAIHTRVRDRRPAPKPNPTLPLAAAALLAVLAAAVSSPAQSPRPTASGLSDRSSPLQVAPPDEGDRELRTTPVVRAVRRAADSVVSIYLQNQLSNRQKVTEGQGSGVLIDDSGLVITNWHVIAPVLLGERSGRQYETLVKLRDRRERSARILSSSPKHDLALLQLQLGADEHVQPIEIGRSADLMIGETVIAIGNPQGHANTVTTGVLSATGRSIQVRAPDGVVRSYTGLLQTDAAINQGNSGGALLDITGRLIGINNAMAAGAENIGFAIPIDVVRAEFQNELLTSTSLSAAGNAPWLGLALVDRDGAAVVDKVVPGSPADLAGVRVGDLLRKIGDHRVRSKFDFVRWSFTLERDAEVALLLERDGAEHRTNARAIPRYEGIALAGMGVRTTYIDLDSDVTLVRAATRAFYRGSNLRYASLFAGVLRITSVLKDSPAAQTGIEAGDILLGVVVPGRYGKRELPLQSPIDLARLISAQRGEKVELIVLRGDRDLTGTVTLRNED